MPIHPHKTIIKFLDMFFNNPDFILEDIKNRTGYKNMIILNNCLFLTNEYNEEALGLHISEIKEKLVYANFCLGFIMKGRFLASVALLRELMSYNSNKIFVDDKSCLRFVYGKDISLAKFREIKINKEKSYLIINNNECLGFGRLMNKNKNSRSNNNDRNMNNKEQDKSNNYNKQVLKNIYDIGFSMRLELEGRLREIS